MEDFPAPACLCNKVSVRELPTGNNLQRKTTRIYGGIYGGTETLHICSATAHMLLSTVSIHGDITRSFEKCVKPQKQQFPNQTRARSKISGRFISQISAKRDVKRPGETFSQRQTTGPSQPT